MTAQVVPTQVAPVDHLPKPRIFHEKIGETEYEIQETKLDVFEHVTLWSKNPRLLPFTTGTDEFASELEIEGKLRRTKGYDTLAKSIADVGQMDAVYVWRTDDSSKFLVLEGATRVSILRDLTRQQKNQPTAGRHQWVKAKILPSHFDELARVILLARIHVRGTGVRSWGRYIEAKFVHENTHSDGQPGLMSVSDLAKHMGKSVSWVSRLRDAYKFARSFVEHVDNEEAEVLAVQHFSTLEEIAKVTGFGPKVREYGDAEADSLRAEVFDMVRKDVFKEYRDARFMKEFHDDPEKWAQLVQGEKHIANTLAKQISAGGGTLRSKIDGLEAQITRALERDPEALDEADVQALRKALERADANVHVGVTPCQLAFLNFKRALDNASLKDVTAITHDQFKEVATGLEDFRARAEKHNKGWTPQGE